MLIASGYGACYGISELMRSYHWFGHLMGCCWLLALGSFDARGQGAVWTWESGTLEGWYADPIRGNPSVSVVAGYESANSISVTGPEYSTIRIANPGIEPYHLVGSGAEGEFLPFAPEAAIFLDMDHPVPTASGVYLDLMIYGQEGQSRWVCYPDNNYGSVSPLNNGWHRITFANIHAYYYPGTIPPPDGEVADSILLVFNGFAPSNYRIDNFTIQAVPEPGVFQIFGILLGCLGAWKMVRYRR